MTQGTHDGRGLPHPVAHKARVRHEQPRWVLSAPSSRAVTRRARTAITTQVVCEQCDLAVRSDQAEELANAHLERTGHAVVVQRVITVEFEAVN
jgi:hypothetical protein